MLQALPPYALPLGIVLSLAGVMRLAGGADTGARLAGLALPAGFLAAWAWFRGLTWAPAGTLDLTAHIALGGALLGLVVDVTTARARWRVMATLLFLAVCVWATLGCPTALPSGRTALIELTIQAVLLTAGWAVVLFRLGTHCRGTRGVEAMALMVPLALGLAGIGFIAGAPVVAPALGLAVAALGFLVLAVPLGLPLSAAACLGGGGALLGLTQALVMDWPGTLAPALVLALGLYAGPTARHLPGAERLHPLWTGLLALLPAGLALLTALAARG